MTWHIICQQVTNYKEDKPLKTQYFRFDFFKNIFTTLVLIYCPN